MDTYCIHFILSTCAINEIRYHTICMYVHVCVYVRTYVRTYVCIYVCIRQSTSACVITTSGTLKICPKFNTTVDVRRESVTYLFTHNMYLLT